MRGPDYLLTARHVHPGVHTPEDYATRHREALETAARAYPNLTHRMPWRYEGPLPEPFVSRGVWVIRCACGNAPALAPEWGGVARCYEVGCGAVYEHVALPSDAATIERLLLLRPKLEHRNWELPETVDDLRRENLAHGVPDGATVPVAEPVVVQ